ncbi:MAG: hypothetical protein AB1806_05505 [Acidobacteriota bacterium]
MSHLTTAAISIAVVVLVHVPELGAHPPALVRGAPSQTLGSLRLTIAPDRVAAGGTAEGRVVLDAPAPAGGIVVRLRSLEPSYASVPESVSVVEGQTAATFPIEAGELYQPGSGRATITATWERLSAEAELRVVLNSIAISVTPTTLLAGSSATATVTLGYPARKGGMTIPLFTSYTGSFVMPDSIVVPQGGQTATFTLTHVEDYVKPQIEIRAFNVDRGEHAITIVNVQRNEVRDLIFETPGRAVSGTIVQCTVRLRGPAVHDMDLVLGIKEARAPITLPDKVTVRAGDAQTTFPILYHEVFKTTEVTMGVSAFHGGEWHHASLVIDPTAVTALSLDKTTIAEGERAEGRVTLQASAPPGGIHVTLAPDFMAAVDLEPYGLDVPAGQQTAVFTVIGKRVETSSPVTISAIYRGITFKKATVTVSAAPALPGGGRSVKPAAPGTLPQGGVLGRRPRMPGVPTVELKDLTVLAQRSRTGPQSVTITVTLSEAAPAAGVVVTLLSSLPDVLPVPSSIKVNPGQRSAELRVRPQKVPRRAQVRITARYGSTSKSQPVWIEP